MKWIVNDTCTRLELRDVSCVTDVLSMTALFKGVGHISMHTRTDRDVLTDVSCLPACDDDVWNSCIHVKTLTFHVHAGLLSSILSSMCNNSGLHPYDKHFPAYTPPQPFANVFKITMVGGVPKLPFDVWMPGVTHLEFQNVDLSSTTMQSIVDMTNTHFTSVCDIRITSH
jgi:hypothetical protein